MILNRVTGIFFTKSTKNNELRLDSRTSDSNMHNNFNKYLGFRNVILDEL